MRTLSLLIFSLFVYIGVNAQGTDELKFEEQTYDFGTVKEEDGPVTHEFKFVNQGDKPVKITNVKASCGCTTPGWSKEVVGPGEEGFVKAQYDTHNRPGSFYKNLTVFLDNGKQAKLYIKGNVMPRPKSIEEQLPMLRGNLRTKYSSFNMGKVLTTDDPTSKDFEIYNAADGIIIIKSVKHPDFVKVSLPDTLLPGKVTTMTIIYNAKGKGELGFFHENITLVTDENIEAEKSYSLYTNIEEYFPPMTRDELNQAARLSFGEQIYDFSKAQEGEVIENEFVLTNTGKSTLNIRKVDSNCSCLTAELSKNDLEPGESAVIKAKLTTAGRRGNQQKAITVYSNDPTSPVQRLTVKGYVNAAED